MVLIFNLHLKTYIYSHLFTILTHCALLIKTPNLPWLNQIVNFTIYFRVTVWAFTQNTPVSTISYEMLYNKKNMAKWQSLQVCGFNMQIGKGTIVFQTWLDASSTPSWPGCPPASSSSCLQSICISCSGDAAPGGWASSASCLHSDRCCTRLGLTLYSIIVIHLLYTWWLMQYWS